MTQLLEIPYNPHVGQIPFHNSKAKNRIIIAGRQGGKTKAGANEALKLSIKTGSNSVGFVVAPTYWHTTKCWREILYILGSAYDKDGTPIFDHLVKEVNRQERRIVLQPNRYIWFKSADNPDSLRSERLDWAWLDECAMIKEEGWNAIEPALMGPVIMTSTPKGHNWVFELWTRGQDPQQTDFESWNFPTEINPYYPKDKIERARQLLHPKVFQQEYLGMFIEDIGALFRNVKDHIKAVPLKPQKDHRYVAGWDIAKYEDYSVLSALDMETGEQRGYERFSHIDYILQCKRAVNFCKRYNNARLLIDSTGIGDPIYDELRRSNIRVDGYKFTLASKADLVENLSLMYDNDKVWLNDIPEQTSEFELFGAEQSSTGTIKYRAPEGYHDDTVICFALAAWQLKSGAKGSVGYLDW